MVRKLSDVEIHDKLIAASDALGGDAGETVRGDTAISAARKMLRLVQLSLLSAMEKADPTDR